jgi:regulator of protease activity HflC (stomatin/prohibitin superfamily)
VFVFGAVLLALGISLAVTRRRRLRELPPRAERTADVTPVVVPDETAAQPGLLLDAPGADAPEPAPRGRGAKPPAPKPAKAKRTARPAGPQVPSAAGLALLGGAATVLNVAGVLLVVGSCFYTQDVGQAVVQRSVTGEIAGSTTAAGLHPKAPWVSTLRYDVRNNTVTYVGTGAEGDHSGGSATGPQITFQDEEGVTANLDIVVRYSLVPSSVERIYAQYSSQENFVSRVIANDVRQVARDIPAHYGTIALLNDRAKAAEEITLALETKWADAGIIVEEINLQEIRYPESVTARFAEAQNSRIEIERAQADKQRAVVEAETRVITAQGEADANRVLSESLTPQVLQQRYVDALSKSSTVYVVPEGSQPLVATPGGSAVATTP